VAGVKQGAAVASRTPRRIAIIVLICLMVCSGLLTLLIIAARSAREAARCEMCRYHLKLLAVGLKIFADTEGSLPPAYLCDKQGRPVHSWRALIMQSMGYYGWRGGYSLKEPWDGPTNRKWLSHPFLESQCPSVGYQLRSTEDYVAVVGPDTMWPGRERVAFSKEGAGNQDVILLIELPDSDYRCLEPRFPTVDEFIERIKSPTGKGIRCIHPKGLAYVTVGGEVRWFPPDTDPETIRRLFKRDPGCRVIPPEEKIPIVEKWEEKAAVTR
jgi:hypothetical protein